MQEDQSTNERDKQGFFDSYNEYNKILRSWFVAFGIGGPVVFLTNNALYKDFLKLDERGCIVTLFLFGLFTQIAIAFINKVANWKIYYKLEKGEKMEAIDKSFRGSLTEMFWLDWGSDLLTAGAFGLAVYLLFRGLVGLYPLVTI